MTEYYPYISYRAITLNPYFSRTFQQITKICCIARVVKKYNEIDQNKIPRKPDLLRVRFKKEIDGVVHEKVIENCDGQGNYIKIDIAKEREAFHSELIKPKPEATEKVAVNPIKEK